jgi:hypothetical protein
LISTPSFEQHLVVTLGDSVERPSVWRFRAEANVAFAMSRVEVDEAVVGSAEKDFIAFFTDETWGKI